MSQPLRPNRDGREVESFWQGYLAGLAPDHPHRTRSPDAFAFGGGGALADELAELVLAGRKRATTSLPIEFTAEGDSLPEVGSLSVVLAGDGRPVAIIERTQVFERPFDAVDAAYAAVEGEGDGSLSSWRAGHTAYFTEVCARLGGRFDGGTPVICQVFWVVWPPDAAR